MAPSAALEELVYHVPWHLRAPEERAPSEGLVLHWFPSSAEELRLSSLRTSRVISLYAAQCVAMEVATVGSPVGQKLAAGATLPVAVLATADGTPLGRAENQKGTLRVAQVEKVVEAEMKQRDGALPEEGEGDREVYWSSEGDAAKADRYVREALAQDPTDPYTLVFAAAFMAGSGQGDEALLSRPPTTSRRFTRRPGGARRPSPS